MTDSAPDRIRFMQVGDAIEQGQGDTLPDELLEPYLQQGWLTRSSDSVAFTDEGRQEYDRARRERQATD